MPQKALYSCVGTLIMFLMIGCGYIHADEGDTDDERMALYQKTEAITHVPWYYLAAVDQYERNTHTNRPDDQIISIQIPTHEWYGIGNINHSRDPSIISMFHGMGRDGNGDGTANPENPEDVLYAMAIKLASNGVTEDDIRMNLWDYYRRDLTVQSITNTANVYRNSGTISLDERNFPIDTSYNYSYQSNWGDRRGFGGLRIHEGTDIFAGYGTPVLATTYGVVELKGWNRFGGWRIGIRDIHNIYHYYAHLSEYAPDIQVGQLVQPGDQLGKVGSTGYGPPGTAGKFPPHLHYGMYKDNGYSEWSFDPYPYLNKWERMTEK